MERLHFHPAPDSGQEGNELSDRLRFPSQVKPYRLRLQDDREHHASDHADPMQDSGLWMDASIDGALDEAQHRLDSLRALFEGPSSPDDDGPRAA